MFAAHSQEEEEDKCFNLWGENNLAIELSYTIMFLAFILQAVYASMQKSKLAI